MLLPHLYEQQIVSKQFITKQLGFEKNMFSLITKNCIRKKQQQNAQKLNQSYHDCAKYYKQQIKHFGLLAQLLIQQRSKELKNEAINKCKKLRDDDQILNCVNKATENILIKHFQKDFQFLNLAREEILKNATISNKKI